MKTRVDLARLWFVASCAVILFAYGVAVGRYEIFPFRILNYGIESVLTLRQEATTLAGLAPAWHLKPARYEGDGVTVAREQEMAPGLTFVTGLFGGEGELRLIEFDLQPSKARPTLPLVPRGPLDGSWPSSRWPPSPESSSPCVASRP